MALKFRRGTTAQQSGSLAFGEPYVNTTLGTLVVGGQTGDIVLSSTGTGSAGNFGPISGSGLDITGNANIAGNLTVGGQLQIGDQTSDTLNVVASLSSSLIPQTSNVFDLGSATKIWRDLYISSGSIKMYDGSGVLVSTITSTTLNANTSSINQFNTFTGSQLTQNTALATISGSLISSASADRVSITNINTTTASLNTSVSNINSFSSSQLTQNSALATISGSLISTASANVVSVANLNTFSGSQLTQNSALATISGSLISTASNHEQRIAANESVSGSYARTNSANTFNGTQTVSGSLYVTQDLVVGGSSSIQNISSSNVVIGAAYVTLNTFSPSSRYAGFNFVDSGSVGGSGSFYYDSVDDEMVFVHKGNGTNITSSQVLMGPETYDSLGNEIYLTKNKLPKAEGFEHLGDSQITDDGTTVSIAGNLDLTGSMKAPQLNAIATITGSLISSASVDTTKFGTLQTYTASVDTRLTTLGSYTSSLETRMGAVATETASLETRASTLATYTSSLETRMGAVLSATASLALSASTALSTNNTQDVSISNLNTTSASVNTSVTNLNSYTSSFAAASVTLTNKTISGTNNTLSNIANASLTNSSITIAGTSTSLGGTITLATITGGSSIVSGSSISSPAQGQVTLTTNGVAASAVNIVNLQTTSTPTFAGLTINGAITATGDITAYYSSDKRYKNNIQVIGNALDKVKKLNGVTWEWNDNVNDVTKAAPTTGLIAQEVQEVLPQVVKEKEDGFLGLDYAKMIGLLVEAIKEQQQHIDNLTIQVEELKKQKGL